MLGMLHLSNLYRPAVKDRNFCTVHLFCMVCQTRVEDLWRDRPSTCTQHVSVESICSLWIGGCDLGEAISWKWTCGAGEIRYDPNGSWLSWIITWWRRNKIQKEERVLWNKGKYFNSVVYYITQWYTIMCQRGKGKQNESFSAPFHDLLNWRNATWSLKNAIPCRSVSDAFPLVFAVSFN